MSYCTNCGNKIREGALFCINCGMKLAEVEPQTPQTEQIDYDAVNNSAINNINSMGNIDADKTVFVDTPLNASYDAGSNAGNTFENISNNDNKPKNERSSKTIMIVCVVVAVLMMLASIILTTATVGRLKQNEKKNRRERKVTEQTEEANDTIESKESSEVSELSDDKDNSDNFAEELYVSVFKMDKNEGFGHSTNAKVNVYCSSENYQNSDTDYYAYVNVGDTYIGENYIIKNVTINNYDDMDCPVLTYGDIQYVNSSGRLSSLSETDSSEDELTDEEIADLQEFYAEKNKLENRNGGYECEEVENSKGLILDGSNLFYEPDYMSNVITYLPIQSDVTVYGLYNEWAFVGDNAGNEGWIPREAMMRKIGSEEDLLADVRVMAGLYLLEDGDETISVSIASEIDEDGAMGAIEIRSEENVFSDEVYIVEIEESLFLVTANNNNFILFLELCMSEQPYIELYYADDNSDDLEYVDKYNMIEYYDLP